MKRVQVDRYNSGPQGIRRYHHPSGAKICCYANRARPTVIPASMPVGVSVPVERRTAAELIRDARRQLTH